MLEIRRCVALAEPEPPVRVRRQEPALASFHPLILALCRQTRRFPGGDPVELGLGIRAAALGAAETVLAACELRGTPVGFATALVEAVRRLRELACCIEIARRLGYLGDRGGAELLALHDRAFRAVSALARRGCLRQLQPCAASTRRAGSLSQ
ncbi:MAG TPA: hypothetical protein VMW75_16850 [Thermoanaerobaculia bacterium]|nr:hypothetical protein [Thermoanaerobaculia bacterium]